jgi:hypothetical protein
MNGGVPELAGLGRRSLAAGVIALAALAAGGFLAREQFFRSYQLAFIFWSNVALGALALGLMQNLTGGGWGLVIRRPLEAGMRTLPLVAVLFVPLAFGLGTLYEWSHAEAVAADPLLQHKSAYLNPAFFLARAAIYFAVWIGIALWTVRTSDAEDRAPDARLSRRLRVAGAPGLLLYGLTATFAAFDWGMSLDPHWFSTIYGVIFILGQALGMLALVIPVLARLREREPLAGLVQTRHFHDLGSLLFAFVMLWAYVSFSQFLIIWSGNLPEEVTWYRARLGEGWQGISLALVLAHFAVPFLVLLSRRIKRGPETLAKVAIALFLLRGLDIYWLLAPSQPGRTGVAPHWMDAAAWLGLGGIWMWWYVRELGRRPLLAANDPRVEEVRAAAAEAAAHEAAEHGH